MTTKQDIQLWLDHGYDVLVDGNPIKVEGDIWEFIRNKQDDNTKILVLREVINWEEEELSGI